MYPGENVQFIHALFKLNQQAYLELLYDRVCIIRFSSGNM